MYVSSCGPLSCGMRRRKERAETGSCRTFSACEVCHQNTFPNSNFADARVISTNPQATITLSATRSFRSTTMSRQYRKSDESWTTGAFLRDLVCGKHTAEKSFFSDLLFAFLAWLLVPLATQIWNWMPKDALPFALGQQSPSSSNGRILIRSASSFAIKSMLPNLARRIRQIARSYLAVTFTRPLLAPQYFNVNTQVYSGCESLSFRAQISTCSCSIESKTTLLNSGKLHLAGGTFCLWHLKLRTKCTEEIWSEAVNCAGKQRLKQLWACRTSTDKLLCNFFSGTTTFQHTWGSGHGGDLELRDRESGGSSVGVVCPWTDTLWHKYKDLGLFCQVVFKVSRRGHVKSTPKRTRGITVWVTSVLCVINDCIFLRFQTVIHFVRTN